MEASRHKGTVVNFRRHDDKISDWSVMLLSEDGNVFYIRDYKTSFPQMLANAFLNVIGTSVDFEAKGDLVTKVLAIDGIIKKCSCCSVLINAYDDENGFNRAKKNLLQRITRSSIFVRPISSALDITFVESNYCAEPTFIFPPTYYELQFYSFLCKTCNSIFCVDDTERSSFSGKISYRKYPFSQYMNNENF